MAGSDLFIKGGFCLGGEPPSLQLPRQEVQEGRPPDPRLIVERERALEEVQKGRPHDPGCRSVPYGCQVCEGYCGGVQDVGA